MLLTSVSWPSAERGLDVGACLPLDGESRRDARWSKAWKMSASKGKIRARQAVGSFHEARDLRGVVKVLADQGVAASDLTVMVGRAPLDERFLPYTRSHPGTILDGALNDMRPIGTTAGAGPLLVSSSPFGDRLTAAAAAAAAEQRPGVRSLFLHAGFRHAMPAICTSNSTPAPLCSASICRMARKRSGRAERFSSTANIRCRCTTSPFPTQRHRPRRDPVPPVERADGFPRN